MPVTIDPATFVINVPKSFLTLVQATPTEIYELDTNSFRLTLKDLEYSQGIVPFLKTHDHNTEVFLGGITFARTIEILEPYTVTFEDGQYAINFINSNNNIGDVTNVNSVSIRPNNSAGLISSPDIEYNSFNQGVSIDVNSGNIGTTFPIGTPRAKVNNIQDAILIAEYRGFDNIYVYSDLTLGAGVVLDDYLLRGTGHLGDTITVLPEASVNGCTMENIQISGTISGGTSLQKCWLDDINFVSGRIVRCGLAGTIHLGDDADAYLSSCGQVDLNNSPILDMTDTTKNVLAGNYTGSIRIENLSAPSMVGIGLDAGIVILDSTTVTSGTVQVNGTGMLVDENGDRIDTGTWNGGVTVINNTMNSQYLQELIDESSTAITAEITNYYQSNRLELQRLINANYANSYRK